LAKLSQTKKVVEFLKAKPNQKYKAHQIAESIVTSFPDDYREKRQNSRFADGKAIYGQQNIQD